MSILSQEELKIRKDLAHDSEIRQNVKSHCSRISEGIKKNGSASGNRAIWELFQNAVDISDRAEVKIVLSNSEFVFAHKGDPFTYDSLCSLVKQVSSHEKEDNSKVGRYGTGFLTTHKFGRKITVTGSMLISDHPKAYVDIPGFVINRENFNNLPLFIEDMKDQIKYVEDLMDAEQKPEPQEWTCLSYGLNEERLRVAQTSIDEAIKLLPYVLTFNDKISKCEITDQTRNLTVVFSKEDKETQVEDLHCARIIKESGPSCKENIDCYYLQLHNDDSRIILPLKTESEVKPLGDVPRLYVHYPLLGPNDFGVNFVYHSHKLTPNEPRENIIVPNGNDATDLIAEENVRVLNEMTHYLWRFLENNVELWKNTIEMASLNIRTTGFDEIQTADFYKDIKKQWVDEFAKLELIDSDSVRYSMSDEYHPLVLEPSLEEFISNNPEKDYISVIYDYAKGAALVPCQEELLQWSRILAGWNETESSYYLPLERIVSYVSNNQGSQLHNFLEMLAVDSQNHRFFEDYALLPNREGKLKKKSDLRNANDISPELYDLVHSLDSNIGDNMVDIGYSDIVKLTPYTRQNLRDDVNSSIKKQEDEYWKGDSPTPYLKEFENALIALCSTFTSIGGDSKRNKIMPVICRFEGIEYQERCIPAAENDLTGFDLYRSFFLSLVENQMMKIGSRDKEWVNANIEDLAVFVENARGDDYKNFCYRYAIYPDMKGNLHKPDELKCNHNVNDTLFDLYSKVIQADLREKCVDLRFESYYDKYTEEAYQYTPESVAREITNKLSADNYQDTIVLDIIDLIEGDDDISNRWQSLFKDIYEQRESIRYKLGTPQERKAVNRMMRNKNPELLERMADVSERNDANKVLDCLNKTIDSIDEEAHNKLLGDFVEEHVQEALCNALKYVGVAIRNEQGGQDLILSKEGYEDYYIEIKSRWAAKQPALMSPAQFENAVAHPDRYALISAQMWNFDQSRAKRKEKVAIEELEPLLRVCNQIGYLEKDLKGKVDEAFAYDEAEISAVGNYDVHVPQKVCAMTWADLIESLIKIFG